jgi:hypothetical protein
MFQVTPTGDIVWEYVNPHFGSQTYTSLNTENRTVSTNWVFRAQPIPYDWAPEGTPRSEKGVAPSISRTIAYNDSTHEHFYSHDLPYFTERFL